MNDSDNGTWGWIVGLLVALAIVLLVAFARGPEEQERSSTPLAIATTELMG
jgi:hypothetical protein